MVKQAKTNTINVSRTRRHFKPVSLKPISVLRGAVIVVLGVLIFSFTVSAQTHTVQSGESLWSIANKYDTSVAELIRLNGISNPNLIIVGQQLQISGQASVATEKVYYVKAGDTLSGIAVKLNSTVAQLAQRNNISNPNFLQIGQTIKHSGGYFDSAPTSFQYRVRSGDTLAKIATKFETSASAINKLNGFNENTTIYAKQLIRVPSPKIVGTIHHWAVTYGVPSDLMLALTWWESGWDNSLTSSANAIGIGQLIPSTVSFVSEALIGRRLNPYIPEQNVQMSARFMAYLMSETAGNSSYALGAYYQGLGALRRHGIYNSSWSYINGIQALRSQFK